MLYYYYYYCYYYYLIYVIIKIKLNFIISMSNEHLFKNNFDPITHKQPKFDIYGCLVI
jgi:hypothetical protein